MLEAAAPGAPELPFNLLYPNLQFLDGPVCVLDNDAKQWYLENLDIGSYAKYLKHLSLIHI